MSLKISFPYRLPAVLGLAHGISDGTAGLLLGSLATNSPATKIMLLVLIYNALAFGSQPLIGYFADSLRSPRIFASGGMAFLAASLITRGMGFGECAVLMSGLGSAAFHVGAGALTLRSCGGRSDAAGLFAAPGVIGLAIGGALSASGHYLYLPFLVALLSFIVVIQTWPVPAAQVSAVKTSKEPIFESHDWIMIGLLTAVALRSLVWTSFQLAGAGQITALIALGVAAGIGKIIGGFAAERLGYRRWTMISLLMPPRSSLSPEKNSRFCYPVSPCFSPASPARLPPWHVFSRSPRHRHRPRSRSSRGPRRLTHVAVYSTHSDAVTRPGYHFSRCHPILVHNRAKGIDQ